MNKAREKTEEEKSQEDGWTGNGDRPSETVGSGGPQQGGGTKEANIPVLDITICEQVSSAGRRFGLAGGMASQHRVGCQKPGKASGGNGDGHVIGKNLYRLRPPAGIRTALLRGRGLG